MTSLWKHFSYDIDVTDVFAQWGDAWWPNYLHNYVSWWIHEYPWPKMLQNKTLVSWWSVCRHVKYRMTLRIVLLTQTLIIMLIFQVLLQCLCIAVNVVLLCLAMYLCTRSRQVSVFIHQSICFCESYIWQISKFHYNFENVDNTGLQL